MQEFNKKLIEIQQELKAPKDLWNDFSKYNYRSAESIEGAVKPLCHAKGLSLICSDTIICVGGWNYVEASAILSDGINEEIAKAQAREQEVKKGMDAAQITGAASSYARKYALCGLFAIDDTKDADGQDNSKQPPKRAVASKDEPASLQQRNLIKQLLEKQNILKDDMPEFLESEFGVIPGATILKNDASNIIKELLKVSHES